MSINIEKGALGAAVKQVRIARGLTQVQLAKAAGFSKGGKSIALIEQGKRNVSVDSLNVLARALDIPPACLAILGSRSVGKKDDEAADFMESLKNLVSSVLLAEKKLQVEEKKGLPGGSWRVHDKGIRRNRNSPSSDE